MILKNESLNFEQLALDHEVIGWLDGYAILQNEMNDLLCVEIPEEFAVPGTVLPNASFMAIENLPDSLQKKIKDQFNG